MDRILHIRKHILKLLLIVALVPLLCPVPVYAASTYKSWVRGTTEYNAAYGADTMPTEGIEAGSDVVDKINDHPDDTDPDTTEKMWSKIIVGWGTGISKALKGGTIDASITGIIMGKLVNGVNYFVFDLTDQNPYGTIGSIIYVTFRHLCLSIIFIFALWKIVTGGLFSDRGAGQLKSAAYSLIVFLVLLYCMPLIVDWVCELRDFMSKEVFLNLNSAVTGAEGGLKETLSLEDEYLQKYNDSKTTLDALIYFAMCITPIVYFLSYVKIALTVLVMFGLFPLFATVSVRDPKQLSNWCSIVFANLFVPMVDLLLLLIPSLIITVINGAGVTLEGSVLKAVLVVMMLMNAIAAREIVLKMFGNSLGIAGGLGAAGAAGAIAGMAKKALGAAKEALGGGESKESDGGMDKDEANDRDVEAEKDLKDTQNSLNEIKGSNESGSGMGATDDDDEGSKGLDEIEPLQGNGLNAIGGGAEDGDNENEELSEAEDNDETEDVDAEALKDVENLEDLPPSQDEEVTDEESPSEDNESTAEEVKQFRDDYGDDGERPDLEGAQKEGDIGEDLTNKENDLGDIPPNPENAPFEGPVDETESYDNSANAPSAGGDLAGNEETNNVEVVSNSAGGMGSTGEGFSDEDWDRFDDNNEDNPLDSMRKDAASPEALSNVQSEADKAIADATVTKEDLERSSGGEMGKLRDSVAENSPQSAGPNKELDRQINMTRAANLQTLDNLRAKSEMLDKDNASAQHTIAANSSLINSNAARLKDLDRAERAVKSNYKDEYGNDFSANMSEQDKTSLQRIHDERDRIEASTRSAEQSVEAAKNRIATNSAVKQHLSAEINRRQGTEAELANIQENRGMSGKTFSSTKEFTRKLEHDNNLRKTMSYKNFANEKYSGILTPQERAQFQRQQNIRRAVSATARFTGNVVGGAAMVAGGAAAMVALSGAGRDGVQIGADIMATGLGKMGAGVAQPVSAVSKQVKGAMGDAATQAVYRAPDAARAAKDRYDSFSEKWIEHQLELQKPNEDKPMITRAELEARRAAGSSPQRNPKDVPLTNISGSEEARMFNEQANAGKGDPTVEKRARQAEEAARKAQSDYENRSGGNPVSKSLQAAINKATAASSRSDDPGVLPPLPDE